MKLIHLTGTLFFTLAATQVLATPKSEDPFAGLQDQISSVHFTFTADQEPLTDVQVGKLSGDLFDATGVAMKRFQMVEEGRMLFTTEQDPSAVFDLDRVSGDFLFNKGYAEFYGQNDTPNLPDASVAPDVAKGLLANLGLLPKATNELTIDHIGGINMGARNEDGSVHEFKKLVTVRFGRQIDGTPVVGPGSRIVVRLGKDGELAALIRNWSPLQRQPLAANERLNLAEVQQLAKLRLQGVEAKTLSKDIVSAEVVLFDDGKGVIEPAVRVIATLTIEQVLEGAVGNRESRIIENPYDFFIPLSRNPQAVFPFMKAPARSPQEVK